jgi:hypothetical protein
MDFVVPAMDFMGARFETPPIFAAERKGSNEGMKRMCRQEPEREWRAHIEPVVTTW